MMIATGRRSRVRLVAAFVLAIAGAAAVPAGAANPCARRTTAADDPFTHITDGSVQVQYATAPTGDTSVGFVVEWSSTFDDGTCEKLTYAAFHFDDPADVPLEGARADAYLSGTPVGEPRRGDGATQIDHVSTLPVAFGPEGGEDNCEAFVVLVYHGPSGLVYDVGQAIECLGSGGGSNYY